MKQSLKSSQWNDTALAIRKCHLSLLDNSANVKDWTEAFNKLISAINAERVYNPTFASELYYLTIDTSFAYDLKDVLEEYFNFLEANKAYDEVIASAQQILNTFAWNNFKPSEYKYRIGNALMEKGELAKAEEFGKTWLNDDPTDLYAAASNAFLKAKLGKMDEAKAIVSKYLDPSLMQNRTQDSLLMAAEELYDKTEDKNAKQRIAEKISQLKL